MTAEVVGATVELARNCSSMQRAKSLLDQYMLPSTNDCPHAGCLTVPDDVPIQISPGWGLNSEDLQAGPQPLLHQPRTQAAKLFLVINKWDLVRRNLVQVNALPHCHGEVDINVTSWIERSPRMSGLNHSLSLCASCMKYMALDDGLVFAGFEWSKPVYGICRATPLLA